MSPAKGAGSCVERKRVDQSPDSGWFEGEGIVAHLGHRMGHLQWPAVDYLSLQWTGRHYAPAGERYPRLVPRGGWYELDDGRNTWILHARDGTQR